MFCWWKKTNYAEFVKLCAACPIIHKIMREHNRIIPLSLRKYKREKLLDRRGQRTTPPLGLQIYRWPRVTSTFDLFHPSCWDTRTLPQTHKCLQSALVKDCRTVPEIYDQKPVFRDISAPRDLLDPKVYHFTRVLSRPLAPICVDISQFTFKISCSQLTLVKDVTNRSSQERKHQRTTRQHNASRPAATLARRRHEKKNDHALSLVWKQACCDQAYMCHFYTLQILDLEPKKLTFF